MKYADRNGNRRDVDSSQDKFLKRVYKSPIGRGFVKVAINPIFSKIGGGFLSSGFSKPMIKSFVKKNNIDLSKCTKQNFSCYNEFFTRQLKDGERVIDVNKNAFISPCDSKLFVSKINEYSTFNIKHTDYTVYSLVKDKALAKEFIGGYAFIFRLTVDDYHRYCYPDSGHKSANTSIAGKLHTVNPVANDIYPIYKENAREYCTIQTENFDKIIFMEVGALMVGKIKNHRIGEDDVTKGQEKGMFEFGGSTVIVLTKKGVLKVDEDILLNSSLDYETIVKMGEKIAERSL